MGIFDRTPVVEHSITKTWTPGQANYDFVQKVWHAECSCGWRSAPGSFIHVGTQEANHVAAVEQAGELVETIINDVQLVPEAVAV